jgi:hypothetical protein
MSCKTNALFIPGAGCQYLLIRRSDLRTLQNHSSHELVSQRTADNKENDMLIRTELWTVEAAKSWLRNYEWGDVIANTLEENPSPIRQTAWIGMVMDMEAMLSEANAVQPATESVASE